MAEITWIGTSFDDDYSHNQPYPLKAYGKAGNDNITGGNGPDKLYGGKGRDILSGNQGNDKLYGGQGNDFLSGDRGNDELFGDDGNDNLEGGAGNDSLIGGKGNDYLTGYYSGYYEYEYDALTGGQGSDTFVLGEYYGVHYLDSNEYSTAEFDYYPNSSYGLIKDFKSGEDIIQLNGSINDYYNDYYLDTDSNLTGGGKLDTQIYYTGDNQFDLIGVVADVTNLTLSNFTFVDYYY
jgi:Ca2+-binding RTX toxin-like protein